MNEITTATETTARPSSETISTLLHALAEYQKRKNLNYIEVSFNTHWEITLVLGRGHRTQMKDFESVGDLFAFLGEAN
jgi:hypothetical protein